MRKSGIIIIILTIILGLTGCAGSSEDDWNKGDGEYYVSVSMEGDTGRASVESPALVNVNGDSITVNLVWSSAYYDYMIYDGVKYINEAEAGENSRFAIPVKELPGSYTMIADTTAMSVPHEIEYIFTFSFEGPEFGSLEKTGSLENQYATGFQIDYYGIYEYLTISESGEYLLVPEGAQVPLNVPESITVLKKPLTRGYLVATSAMDMLAALDTISDIRLSGTKAEDWYIDKAKIAMEAGELIYAGKYNAPDYELLVNEGCDIAIESTMIYHNPDVKDKLNEVGIPVLVERSSYEGHPLGRLEWIKLYGALFDCEEKAKTIYDEQVSSVMPVLEKDINGKTVAFFYVTASGAVNVRKPGDYISKMIGLAGGEYVIKDLNEADDNALSTMNMQMEDFYKAAIDADYIIYNSATTRELDNIDDLLSIDEIFKDFKAVKSGNVYCTYSNFFQETMGTCDFINDLNKLLTGEEKDEFRFLKHLN